MVQTLPPVPDYHFLLFAPGLDAWLFSAAQRYWTVFRPVMYTMRTPEDVDLIAFTAEDGEVSLAVTVVMRRDTAPAIRGALSLHLSPDVYLDPLVYDDPADLRLTLDSRAAYNQRFGVPIPPTPVAPSPVPSGTP